MTGKDYLLCGRRLAVAAGRSCWQWIVSWERTGTSIQDEKTMAGLTMHRSATEN